MLPPFPHQTTLAQYGADRMVSLWAADPGTGKTRAAIMMIDANPMTMQRILIVCPASALGVWPQQFREWSTRTRPLRFIETGTREFPPGVWLVSYNLLSRHKDLVEALTQQVWDLLICDEAHKLKSPTSARTRAVFGPRCRNRGIAGRARKVCLLTGTPIINAPDEIWPLLRAFFPKAIAKSLGYDDFVARYSHRKEVWLANNKMIYKVTGVRAERLPELKAILAPFMLRVRVEDVQKDLPPLIWQRYPLRADEEELTKIASEWRAAELAMGLELGKITDPEAALAKLVNLKSFSTWRRLTGVLKAGLVAEAVLDEYDSGIRSIGVFAYHREVLDRLETSLSHLGVARIDGSTSQQRRALAVADFQSGVKSIFLGQIESAGEAITLTRGQRVWLAEMDVRPTVNFQAAKRFHRQGQLGTVLVRACSLANSIDEVITDIIATKAQTIALTLDDVLPV